jgi:hypothetical protein
VDSLILISLVDLPMVLLAFFGGVRIIGALCFPARVFDAPTLALAIGSIDNSPPGDRAKTGIVGIGISPLQTQEWEK